MPMCDMSELPISVLAQAEHDKKCIIEDGTRIGIRDVSFGWVYYTKAKIVDNEIVVYYTKDLIMITGATKNCDWGDDNHKSFVADIIDDKVANFNYINNYIAGESMSVNYSQSIETEFGYHPDTIITLTIVPITSEANKTGIAHPHC